PLPPAGQNGWIAAPLPLPAGAGAAARSESPAGALTVPPHRRSPHKRAGGSRPGKAFLPLPLWEGDGGRGSHIGPAKTRNRKAPPPAGQRARHRPLPVMPGPRGRAESPPEDRRRPSLTLYGIGARP